MSLNGKKLTEFAVKVLADSIKYRTVLGEDYEELVDYYREVLSSYGVHVTIHRVPDEYLKRIYQFSIIHLSLGTF
jgi:hypothetical protein